VKEIHKKIPNTHLVMHGSSSVPQEWLKIINTFGGKIHETYGVPVSEIQEAIKHGVRKINIDTDLRLAATGAIRRFFAENPSEFDPRSYNKIAKEAMKAICKARFQEFGSAGRADKIKVVSLEAMAGQY
jgi:fructose-bisphosphate aldolase class II